jgi:hypothetical protein
MSATVRIEATAHAALSAIARAKHVSLSEALSFAVEALRRQVFLESLNAGYAELREDSDAWAAEEAERAIWDRAIADGLEHEGRYPLERTSRTVRTVESKTRRRRARAK